MTNQRNASYAALAASLAGAWGIRNIRRRRDPVRAPGHQHRPPAYESGAGTPPEVAPGRDQPWIRRSHSDSQQRRFRR